MWQVSDLDGTMVGDGQVADAATAAFQQYWEANAALCGSVLVTHPPLHPPLLGSLLWTFMLQFFNQ